MAKQTNLFKNLPFNSQVTNYQKLMKIGEGTYGEVFKARNKTTGELVAMKKLIDESKHGGISKACVKEVAILNALNHKNIVRLQEICRTAVVKKGSFNSTLYLIFEFCEHDLMGLISNPNVQLGLGQIKMFLKQILNGLYFMHGNSIMHRDLKPSNILVSRNGTVKIGDFGLARPFWSCHDKVTNFTNYVVTLWYRPPELLLGEKNYGPEIDMWSIGCIMAEMFIKVPILRGSSDQKQLYLIAELCGTPTPDIWPEVVKYKLYSKLAFKHSNRKVKQLLQHRVKDLYALDLLDKILCLNPSTRLDTDNALNHDFFWTDPMPEDLRPLMEILPSNMFDYFRKKNAKPDPRIIEKRQRIVVGKNEYFEQVY